MHTIKRLILLALFSGIPAFASVGFVTGHMVQNSNNCGSSCTTLTTGAIASQSAGNMNVVAVGFCLNSGCSSSSAGVTITISDSKGNAYTLAKRYDGSTTTQTLAVYISTSIASNASTTFTCAVSTTVYYMNCLASEWTGQATSGTVDVTGAADLATSSSSPISVSTSGATTAANDGIYGVVNSNVAFTAGSGFSVINASTPNMMDEWKNQASLATATATFAFTGTATIPMSIVIAFKPSGGGSVVNPPHTGIF